MDGFLCLCGVYLDQRVDVVQGVEKEMRVDLVLEVRKLSLRLILLDFFALRLVVVPFGCHLYRHRDAHYRHIDHRVAESETDCVECGVMWRGDVRRDEVPEKEMDPDADLGDQKHVPEQERPEPLVGEEVLYQK